MYNNYDTDDSCISLHDCRADKIIFENGILSFYFPNGFVVTSQHIKNQSDNTVYTDCSQVDFPIADKDINGIEIYIFSKRKSGEIIREARKVQSFINDVNSGKYEVEFITQYKSAYSILFKCWIWFDNEPYHSECEIILNSNNGVYLWNNLRDDCKW